MKNWKKNIGFAVVFVVLAGFASSCSNNSKTSDDEDDYTEVTQSTIDTNKFVGTWKLTAMKRDGTTVPASHLPNMTGTFTTTTYTQVAGSTTTNGNYFATATKLTLKPSGGGSKTMQYTMPNTSTYIATYIDNNIKFVMTFTKQ